MRVMGILIAAMLTTGCASALTWKDFEQGSSSREQFNRDNAACRMEANKYAPTVQTSSFDPYGPFNTMMSDCMRSKGYERK